jgi:hypothetical protein
MVMLIINVAVFAGCRKDEVNLIEAMIKTKDINSMETTTNIRLNCEIEGLNEEEIQDTEMFLNMLNKQKIVIHTKLNENEERTKSIMQSDISAYIGLLPVSTTIWVDKNLSSNGNIKRIIKVPLLCKGFLPLELQNKEYILYDFNDINKINIDQVTGLISLSQKYKPKFINVLNEFVKEYNAGDKIVTYVGNKTINEHECRMYQIKLNDKNFKELLQNTFNSILKEEKFIKLLKEYLLDILLNVETEGDLTTYQKEIDSYFDKIPNIIDKSDKAFLAFEHVKIIDDEGITIKYYVNKESYIIYKELDINLIIDAQEINNIINNHLGKEKDIETGVLKINIKSDTNISGINKKIKIKSPNVSDDNSINIVEIFKPEL